MRSTCKFDCNGNGWKTRDFPGSDSPMGLLSWTVTDDLMVGKRGVNCLFCNWFCKISNSFFMTQFRFGTLILDFLQALSQNKFFLRIIGWKCCPYFIAAHLLLLFFSALRQSLQLFSYWSVNKYAPLSVRPDCDVQQLIRTKSKIVSIFWEVGRRQGFPFFVWGFWASWSESGPEMWPDLTFIL